MDQPPFLILAALYDLPGFHIPDRPSLVAESGVHDDVCCRRLALSLEKKARWFGGPLSYGAISV